MLLKVHSEIKTVALITKTISWDISHVCERQVAEEHGLTVVAEEPYESGTTDFYPLLTKILAKKPDAINFEASMPGDITLMIKQASELGYTGVLFATGAVPLDYLIATAGKEAAEEFVENDPVYTDPMWPEAVRALYQEYTSRYPDIPMCTTTMSAFASVNLYVKAIQQASTTDTDAVRAVIDDPNFSFDFFGVPDTKLGGREFYGVARGLPHPLACSVIRNGEVVLLDIRWVEVP